MAKTNIPSFDTTAANNTDINGISIAPGYPAADIRPGFNNLMKLLKEYLANSATVASASTIDFGAQTGNYLVITGTTAITALGTVAAGTWKDVKFTGTPLLTYNATSLILPGAANIQTVAGDTCRFVSESSGNWRCLWYNRASGAAIFTQPTPAISEIGGLLPTSIAGTSTTATITITAGAAADSTNVQRLTLGSTSWAVTNGNAINGYAGGATLPNSSTIHFFICFGTSGTGTFASTSLTPTFPTGYTTYTRRIFSLTTTAAGAFTDVGSTAIQVSGGGCKIIKATPFRFYTDATVPTAGEMKVVGTPTGISVLATIDVKTATTTAGATGILITPPAAPDEVVLNNHYNMALGTATNNQTAAGTFEFDTDTSAQLRFRSATTNLTTQGWLTAYTDNRVS